MEHFTRLLTWLRAQVEYLGLRSQRDSKVSARPEPLVVMQFLRLVFPRMRLIKSLVVLERSRCFISFAHNVRANLLIKVFVWRVFNGNGTADAVLLLRHRLLPIQ